MRVEQIGDATLYCGDCIEVMAELPEQSVNCCVTSPPYFGLRDYGCDGQIGLEETPDQYVEKMVEVFRGVRRILREDGTVWLNLGDSYAGSWGNAGGQNRGNGTQRPINSGSVIKDQDKRNGSFVPPASSGFKSLGIKPKDLIGIPWRVALALQADGWYLRQDIIWHKPNPMPESVTDRCTKAHEYIFLLSRSAKYYYDHEAIKEPAKGGIPGNRTHKHQTAYEDGDVKLRTKAGLVGYAERQRSKRDSFKRENSKRSQAIPGQSKGTHRPDRDESEYDTETRNKRSVWTVSTKPYKEAHFAVFPPDLIEPCILAGCPEGGTVFDPFSGSGTTGEVATMNNRHYIGSELNPEYVDISVKRLTESQRQLRLFT